MTQSTLTDQFKCRSMHPVKDINVVIRVGLEMIFDTIPKLRVVSIYLHIVVLQGMGLTLSATRKNKGVMYLMCLIEKTGLSILR